MSHRPSLSPDGRFLVCPLKYEREWASIDIQTFSTGAPGSAAATELWLFDLETGSSKRLIDEGRNYRPSWSPDGSKLAFYSDHTGVVNVWCWNREEDEILQLSKEPIFSRVRNDTAAWTPDGKTIFVPLRPIDWAPGEETSLLRQPQDDDEEASTVDVFISPPPSDAPFPFGSDTSNEPSEIGRIDVETEELVRFAPDVPTAGFFLSPNGAFLALLGLGRIEGETGQHPRLVRELHIMASEGGPSRKVTGGLTLSEPGVFSDDPCWSPDSLAIAFIRDGAVHRYDIGDGETEELPTDSKVSSGFLRWLPDGKNLIAVEKDDPHKLIVVPANASEPKRLSLPSGKFGANVVRRRGAEVIWSPDGDSCIVVTQDEMTKRAEFWRLPFDGSEGSVLFDDDISVSEVDAPSTNGGNFVYAAETSSVPAEFWKTDVSFDKRRRATDINPHIHESLRGSSRLIRYFTAGGEEAFGAFLIPPTFEEGSPVPVVVEIYPTDLSRSLNRWNPAGGVIPLQLLVSRGYGVFLPDSRPGKAVYPATQQLTSTVLPAINELVRLGIADPERLGVMGQSAGGWAVNLLITQTNRFKAAVSAAGLSDLVSMFGQLTVLANGYPYAHGAALMEAGYGGPPWEKPTRYIENSAVFHLDRVETPLLLLHGSDDPGVSDLQAGEMFVGLRRLGKKVEFARYRGEGHVPGMFRLPNRRDVIDRVIAWFDEHLKN